MLQSIDRKSRIFFYFIILFTLSTINNKSLVNKLEIILGIKEIIVKGLEVQEKNMIEKQLNYLINKNIFLLKKSLIETEIYKNSFIESAEIKKIYPSKLLIKTKKAELLAFTIKGNKEYYIGSNGKFILKKKIKGEKKLPIVFGNFRIEEFLLLIREFSTEGFEPKSFKKFLYFQNKRWDVKIKDNLVVKLPRKEILKAIKKLKIILESKENIKYKNIDLRISNQIILN